MFIKKTLRPGEEGENKLLCGEPHDSAKILSVINLLWAEVAHCNPCQAQAQGGQRGGAGVHQSTSSHAETF